MLEWERDPTDNDFGCLFYEIASPLHLHTIHLLSLELKVESVSREHAHTNCQTGLMAWEAGHLLAELVMQCPQLFKDKVLVELGAGSVPLPSIAAWHCGVRELLVSDGNQECVELARHNMLRNIQTEIKTPQFVQVVWGADADLSEVLAMVPNVDWVLAADVTYSEQGTRDFFVTVVRIAAQNLSLK